MSIVYLGLGSNIGDRLQNITTAIVKLLSLGKLKSCSSIWETSPWFPETCEGLAQQRDFLNCVVLFEIALPPKELIEEILKIELGMGRERRSSPLMGEKFGPRTIDIDILFYDALIINTPDLIIPHPLLHRRKFVLLPLSEVTPHLMHPGLKRQISELLQELNSTENCRIFVLANKFLSEFKKLLP